VHEPQSQKPFFAGNRMLVLICVLLLGAVACLAPFWARDGDLPLAAGPLLLLALALALGGLVQALALRRANARLRQAQVSVDNAGDMIFWSTEREARVMYANQAACDILGYTRQELLALTVMDLNPSRTLENWRRHCLELRTQRRITSEMTFRRKDGTILPVEASASLTEHEGTWYAVGIVRDITARKALEADLRQAQVSVDNAQDMVLWADIGNRTVVYANRAACTALGYSRKEIIGIDVDIINPSRSEQDWGDAYARLRATDRLRYEADYRRKDGSLFPVETSAFFIQHEGRPYAVGIVRDISERKAAEERLRAEMGLNRSLAEAARLLIGRAPDVKALAELLLLRARELTGSRHGYVAFVDQESGALVPGAMTPAEGSGECLLGAPGHLFPSGPESRYRGLWGQSLNTRQGFFENATAEHSAAVGLPHGHLPIRQLLSVPSVSKSRLVGQITLANPGRDYTPADLDTVAALADVLALGVEQILAQKTIVAAKEQAESSSRAKSDFLANMTHEVRTPLNGILGMLQILQNTSLTPDQQDCAAVALESAERLNRLLGNVLEYARLDTAKAEAECLAFPPGDLLNTLQAEFEPKARAKGLVFNVLAAPNLPELVRADPQALRQALAHLLDNAVIFTAAGTVTLAAELTPESPPRLAFRVEDTGIGIPADKRQQVFEAFVQADASITRTFGGAGLGLAIVRRQAERMGGSVKAQDRPGGGTVMLLTVPAECGSCPPG